MTYAEDEVGSAAEAPLSDRPSAAGFVPVTRAEFDKLKAVVMALANYHRVTTGEDLSP